MKRCVRCGETKPLSDFHIHRGRRDGVQTYCKRCRAVIEHMREKKYGRIVNIASIAGKEGNPNMTGYSATKAGVIELTRSMALELAPRIRVCAVAPGYVLTPMQRAEYTDAMLDEVNRKIPLQRHAKPEEIAALFAYLASDDAAYATGQVYTMDGGETAGGLASR